jgi:hypothetical protein
MNPIESTYLETIRKFREENNLPPLESIPNCTPCGAYLKHDLSGVRMKSHIRECQECIELMDKADQDEPDQYEEE